MILTRDKIKTQDISALFKEKYLLRLSNTAGKELMGNPLFSAEYNAPSFLTLSQGIEVYECESSPDYIVVKRWAETYGSRYFLAERESLMTEIS